MNKTILYTMANTLNATKKKTEDNDISIDFILNQFSEFTQKDLLLFRDCIDFMIIYNKR